LSDDGPLKTMTDNYQHNELFPRYIISRSKLLLEGITTVAVEDTSWETTIQRKLVEVNELPLPVAVCKIVMIAMEGSFIRFASCGTTKLIFSFRYYL
jgi:hypothetical protein